MPHKCQVLATAGGLAATAACAYLTYKASYPRTDHIVVFLYGSKKGLRLPRCESLDVLRGQVESGLHVEDCRLFVARDGAKRELKSTTDLQAAYSNTSYSLNGGLLLLATGDNTALSSDATTAAPLTLVPVGPKPLPLIGNLRCLRSGPYKILPYNVWANLFTPEKVARWGDTVLLHIPHSSGDKDILQDSLLGMADYAATTCDPEVVAELLARQDDFPKVWGRKAIERRIQTATGNGLFTSSTLDPDWENAHGLLPRAFNQIRIRNYFGVLLGKTRSFVSAWSQLAASSGTVTSVNDWLTCMTADAVVKASMGLDLANVERKAANEPLHPFIRAFRYAFKSVRGAATIQSEFGKAAALNPFFDGKEALADKLAAAIKTCEDTVDDMLEKTRKEEIGGPNSVLSAMLNDVSPSTGEYVRLCNIYGQVMNLMIAGHETTAATLAWTLYYISTNPDIEARALQEIESVLGDRFEPVADDIPKLFYLEACFREALRLHPAVGTVSRDVNVDTILKDKWYLPRGMRVDINNVALQRREDQWGGKFGDPCKYNPDRFMPGAAEETGRHPNAFNPWGFGVRACIGSQFALWEAKIFLAMVLRCFKLRVSEHYRNPEPSVADGGAAPTPHGLEFMIWTRKGGDAVLKGITSQAAKTEAAPTAAAVTATAAAPTAAAAATPSHNTPLLILYGSNTGTCEELAGSLAAQATAAGFVVKVATLDSAAKAAAGSNKNIDEQIAVLIVTSTYNGTPPDNAGRFAKWLVSKEEGSLSKVAYAVFGVGNSQWAQTYQAFPSQVDLQLPKAGATKVLEMRSGDVDTSDWMETFIAWQDDVIRGLLSHFYVTPPESYNAAAADGTMVSGTMARPRCRVLSDDEPGDASSVEGALERLYKNCTDKDRYYMLEVSENRELQSPGSSRSTRHVQMKLPGGAACAYTAGDHLEVMGNNDPGLVEAALKLLGMTGNERVEWVTNFADDSGAARIPGSNQALTLTLSASQVLTWLVDLAAVPTRRNLGLLAESCPCPPEASQLRQLATDEALYKERISSKRMTLLELLEHFRSAAVSLGELVSLLPRMGPRYYSISSSPLANHNSCSISVSKVTFTTPTGRIHNGAASATIAATAPGGKLMGSVRNLSSSFKLPEDHSIPLVMVGPGIHQHTESEV
eukprot:GHUV01002466.1.p1 GENE.GHUV01002466.1~~GHUV01002466.1.p1  ORF type:complete len:1154 (+),score=313.19 GHUV01002466.1:119-3580(+)